MRGSHDMANTLERLRRRTLLLLLLMALHAAYTLPKPLCARASALRTLLTLLTGIGMQNPTLRHDVDATPMTALISLLRGLFSEGHTRIDRRPCEAHIRAVFILDTDHSPHATAKDLGESDAEAVKAGVLSLEGEDDIEDPVEAEDGVDDHGDVVPVVFVL